MKVDRSMNRTLTLLNIAGWIGVVTVNALANALPINGYTTGELSNMYPNLFTPAGITFSIWAVIYLALFAFVVYTSLRKTEGLKLIGLWFFVSCLANAGWILAWHHRMMVLSVFIMLILLFSLVQAYRNLGIGIRKVSPAEKYCVHAPFSIYLGWITVATVANITTLLVDIGWNAWGLPPNFWTAAVILVATMIGLYILHLNNDILYTLVLVWAFGGIIYQRYVLDPLPYPVILTTAIASILLLLFRYFKNREKIKPAYF